MEKELLNSLLSAEAYPHETSEIEFIETHISWVFLTGSYVYKIKKPVKFSFLDFSTLKKRKFFCEEELHLNRRLSPEIYLSVEPLYEQGGRLNFKKEGTMRDYAVKLKQLPKQQKMDLLLKENKVSEQQIKEIARIVAEFHKTAEVISDKDFASPLQIKQQINDLETVKQVIEKELALGEKVEELLKLCNAFLEKNEQLILSRQENGFIKDCHGDLHSANIFLTEKIYIFDCIEFNNAFRYIDTTSEVAFTAMDLDYFQKPELANAFIEEYVSASGDEECLKLLNLYKSYRANVRCKVAALGFSPELSEEQKKDCLKKIENYLNLALKYAEQL